MPRTSLLLLSAALIATPPISAQSVKKCVDADGNITFMQGDCPKAEAQQDVTIHPENRSPHGELQFPEAIEPGLEWVWVASVLDDNDGGVVVRQSGEAYVIENSLGCGSLWRYQESFAQVFAPGEFGDGGAFLILPDHQQRCALFSVKPMQGSVDLSAIPRRAPVAPEPAAPSPQPVQAPVRAQSAAAPVDDSACRNLRRRHEGLNKRCRGLDECNRKRAAIDDLKRQWEARRCEGALGIGPY